MSRFFFDMKFIFLNCFVNRVPSWWIRKRLYQLLGMKIAKGTRIGLGTVVICPERISIASRSIINEYCHLDGRGGLAIGHDVSISMYSKIISASHRVNDREFTYYEEPVIIHDHVWIGLGGIVLEGSILGEGTVIGAGTVVKGIVEKQKVVIGKVSRLEKNREKVSYKLNYKPYFR